MAISVVIVDDHRVFREGLRAVIDGRNDVAIVGDFGDAEAALEALDELRPDVVLMDLHLGDSDESRRRPGGWPVLDGLAATERIRRRWPQTAVLVLSMLDDRATVQRAIAAGAQGYLVKSSGLEDILRGIAAVNSGQFLLGGVTSRPDQFDRAAPNRIEFTGREQEIVGMLASAASTGQIAERLGISTKTVRNYLSMLYAKLGVEDRGQAVLAAREAEERRMR